MATIGHCQWTGFRAVLAITHPAKMLDTTYQLLVIQWPLTCDSLLTRTNVFHGDCWQVFIIIILVSNIGFVCFVCIYFGLCSIPGVLPVWCTWTTSGPPNLGGLLFIFPIMLHISYMSFVRQSSENLHHKWQWRSNVYKWNIYYNVSL